MEKHLKEIFGLKFKGNKDWKYEDKNINSPTLKEYLDYTKKEKNEK